MKNLKLIVGCSLLFATYSYGQVGIGTTTPNPSAQLEVVANNRGILIPNVSLQSETDNTTIANGNVESLMVFNTSTAAGLQKGYYYWADNKWNKLSTGEIASIVDHLTSTSTTEPLAANQGRVLKDLIDVNTAKVGLTPAQQTLLSNTSGVNSGDQDISGIAVNAAAIADKLAKTEAFTGDVTGTYNATKVAAIDGAAVDMTTTAPTDGQTLKWDNTNSKWVPANDDNSNVTVIDDLTTGGTSDALSAEQGKNLQDAKMDKSVLIDDDSFATATAANIASAESVKAYVDANE
ncbi:MAG: hypothetical protein OIF50_10600, partial [Flavobacteriaceae bacterium]|nr:hypothetical protein [Flavobacteriaceae bacterium]